MTITLALALAAQALPTPEDLARASAAAVAEVVAMDEKDHRPACGDWAVDVRLRILRRSGEARDRLRIVKAFGGLRRPGAAAPQDGPLRADLLQHGRRYLLLFASRHERARYPQGVIGAWAASAAVERAIDDDRYAWSPQFDPASGLTYGRRVEEKAWRIQVRKGGTLLWENALQGRPSGRHAGWGLFRPEELARAKGIAPAPPAWLLRAETATELGDGNPYGLPAGRYHVATTYDAATGDVARIEVSDPGPRLVERAVRAFDLRK